MEYIKLLHVACALVSISGFAWRGYLMIIGSSLLNARIVKIAPHVVDTLLLGSAITLAVNWHLNPAEHPWLTAKIVALIIYILLGTVALKRGKSKGVRVLAFVAALVTFGYIVSAALSKSPWGFF